jgi:hypothetical protein
MIWSFLWFSVAIVDFAYKPNFSYQVDLLQAVMRKTAFVLTLSCVLFLAVLILVFKTQPPAKPQPRADPKQHDSEVEKLVHGKIDNSSQLSVIGSARPRAPTLPSTASYRRDDSLHFSAPYVSEPTAIPVPDITTQPQLGRPRMDENLAKDRVKNRERDKPYLKLAQEDQGALRAESPRPDSAVIPPEEYFSEEPQQHPSSTWYGGFTSVVPPTNL